MSSTTVLVIVLVVLAVLALGAALASLARRRRQERRRSQAEGLRRDASGDSTGVAHAQVEAREAEARAERKRLEAERAEAQAAEAHRGAQMERARHEDVLREADRLDPEVDHRADDYRPTASGHTHEAVVEPPRDNAAPPA